MRLFTSLPTLLVLALWLAPWPADAAGKGKAPKNPLTRAMEQYEKLDYAACLAQLEQARQQAGSSASQQEQARVRLYFGLCNFGLGDSERARRDFREALALDRSIELPAGTSPKIRNSFSEVARLLDAEEAERREATRVQPPPPAPAVAEVPPQALPSATVEAQPSPTPRRWLVPAALGGLAVAGVATGLVLASGLSKLEQSAATARYYDGTQSYQSFVAEGKARALGANIAFAGSAAAAVGAVLVLAF